MIDRVRQDQLLEEATVTSVREAAKRGRREGRGAVEAARRFDAAPQACYRFAPVRTRSPLGHRGRSGDRLVPVGRGGRARRRELVDGSRRRERTAAQPRLREPRFRRLAHVLGRRGQLAAVVIRSRRPSASADLLRPRHGPRPRRSSVDGGLCPRRLGRSSSMPAPSGAPGAAATSGNGPSRRCSPSARPGDSSLPWEASSPSVSEGHPAQGFFAALEIDLLRFTVTRQGSTERWWPNPVPAGGHQSASLTSW